MLLSIILFLVVLAIATAAGAIVIHSKEGHVDDNSPTCRLSRSSQPRNNLTRRIADDSVRRRVFVLTVDTAQHSTSPSQCEKRRLGVRDSRQWFKVGRVAVAIGSGPSTLEGKTRRRRRQRTRDYLRLRCCVSAKHAPAGVEESKNSYARRRHLIFFLGYILYRAKYEAA